MPAPSIHGFAEKVALVINGDKGIGRAVALQLALQGCYVVVSFSDASEEGRSALEELKSLGTLADSLEFIEAKSLIERVGSIYGRLDLLINCLKKDDDSSFLINTLAKESAGLMKERPKPAIVNILHDAVSERFAEGLPENIRQNCVVNLRKGEEPENGLFQGKKDQEIANVALFFLSNESRALDRQTLFIN